MTPCMWVQGRLTKKQVTTTLGNSCPGESSSTSKISHCKARHKWYKKTQNGRNERATQGNHSIQDDHLGGEEIMNNARRKERPPRYLAKVTTPSSPNGSNWRRPFASGWFKMETKRLFLHAQSKIMRTESESQRNRMTQSTEHTHMDHFADRGDVSMSLCNMVHKPSSHTKSRNSSSSKLE